MPQSLDDFLHESLSRTEPGGFLPTDSEIGRHLGLSRSTVQRAMARCARRGLIERGRGRPGRKPGGGSAVPERTRTSVQRVVERLLEGLTTGEFMRGEALPQAKQLCARLGVGATTLSAACRVLAQRGMLSRRGKRYWVSPLRRLARDDTPFEVFLFAEDTEDFQHIFVRDALRHSYVRMQRELARCGCVLRFATSDTLRKYLANWRAQRRVPQGLVMHSTQAETFEHTVRNLGQLFRSHAGRNRSRVRVLYDPRSTYARARRSAHVLHRGTLSTAVARELGAFVVRKGYRELVFFLDATAPYDIRGGYSWASIWPVLKVRTALAQSPCRFRLVVRPPKGTAGKNELWDHQHSLVGGAARATGLLQAQGLTSLAELSAETTLVESLPSAFARPGRSGTLWVFMSDTQASQAMEWAALNRVPVPGTLAIVGLEKNPELLPLGITNVEPDWDTIGYLMAHAVVGDIPVAKTSRGFVRVSAMVNEGTTT